VLKYATLKKRRARPAVSADKNLLCGYCITPAAIRTEVKGNGGGRIEPVNTVMSPCFSKSR
jgi:hypothetical protein